MVTGRPPKFETPEDLENQIELFFDYCEEVDEVPDVEGLAVYLDTTRKTLWEYEKKDEFSNTIKRCKDKIFHKKKQLAFKGKINPTVFIFDAKNNHEYTDKQELDHTSQGEKINIPPIIWANGNTSGQD
jgi:hypothetical protein